MPMIRQRGTCASGNSDLDRGVSQHNDTYVSSAFPASNLLDRMQGINRAAPAHRR